MKHQDHVNLLRDGVGRSGGTWADIGSGAGAFTLALAELLGSGGEIYSVDRDENALREQAHLVRARYPDVVLHPLKADFTQPLALPHLDGMTMANALHFIRSEQQARCIRLLKGYLRPGGRLILVEYNVDRGNPWVPYPVSFAHWEEIASQAGFEHTRLLAKMPSSFLREFYAAMSW